MDSDGSDSMLTRLTETALLGVYFKKHIAYPLSGGYRLSGPRPGGEVGRHPTTPTESCIICTVDAETQSYGMHDSCFHPPERVEICS